MAGRRYFSVIAVVLVIIFSARATKAEHVLGRSCVRHCPIDCPMHLNGFKSHEISGTKRVHCHNRIVTGNGLRSAGCKGNPDKITETDPSVVPPDRAMCSETATQIGQLSTGPSPLGRDHLDPPFHPPRSLSGERKLS